MKKPCKTEGCEELTQSQKGYCAEHSRRNKPCEEPGCMNWCAVFNKNGYCREHYLLGEEKARSRWLDA